MGHHTHSLSLSGEEWNGKGDWLKKKGKMGGDFYLEIEWWERESEIENERNMVGK